MSLERAVLALVGALVLISVLLARWVDGRFLWFTALVGAMVLQSAFTRLCPAAIVLHALGLKPESTIYRLRKPRRLPDGAV